jgi:hypothetical protein
LDIDGVRVEDCLATLGPNDYHGEPPLGETHGERSDKLHSRAAPDRIVPELIKNINAIGDGRLGSSEDSWRSPDPPFLRVNGQDNSQLKSSCLALAKRCGTSKHWAALAPLLPVTA